MLVKELLNKKVLIWGYGLEGKSALDLLQKNNKLDQIIIAADVKINDSVKNVKFITEDKILDYDFDVVIKSSGVSIYKGIFKDLIKKGTIITTITNIVLAEINNFKQENKKNSPITIGITGTKGKSTTSSILHHILQKLGYNSVLVGNIGIPATSIIDNFHKYEYIIIELSSAQCANLSYNLDYGLVLNLMPEHIDWHQTHSNYYKDKLNIANHSSTSILNYNNLAHFKEIKPTKVIYFNNQNGWHIENTKIVNNDLEIFDTLSLHNILGQHIYENFCAILTLFSECGIKIDQALKQLASFKTLEHRLEVFYRDIVNNTIYVDDSISTIPEACMKAIDTFHSYPKIHLILGGYNRQQDYNALINKISSMDNNISIYLMGQTGVILYNLLKNQNYSQYYKYFNNFQDLVCEIKKNNLSDSAVILSPATASFDLFKNFKERGEQFQKLMLQKMNKTN